MQHEPEDTDPTTQRELGNDVEAHWTGKPPLVDDVGAHIMKQPFGPSEADLPDIAEDALLEPGLRKSVNHLRAFTAIPETDRADRQIDIAFDFFASPRRLFGDEAGKVAAIEVMPSRRHFK